MATTDDTTGRHPAADSSTRIRVGGAWLAVASGLFFAGLLVHAPPSPNPEEFMATIAQAPARWMAAHVASAAAIFLLLVAGLIILTSRSRLTETWWTISAWAGLIVAALWLSTAAMLEATVITNAAIAGDTATFTTWNPLAEAHASAIVVLSLAVATIAGNEARSDPGLTPRPAAWIGLVAGIASAGGFILGLGLGIAVGGIVWLLSTLVMSLWTLWFGVALARVDGELVASTRRVPSV